MLLTPWSGLILPRKAGFSLGRTESHYLALNSQNPEVPPLGPHPLLGSFLFQERKPKTCCPCGPQEQQSSSQGPAVDRLQEQYPVLPFSPSIPVDSQENTVILSWAKPSGNEPLRAQPRQRAGPGRGEGMGKMEQLMEASGWALGEGWLGARQDWGSS